MNPRHARTNGCSAILRVLERLQYKSCPQGLHVMAEELQWMGDSAMTHEVLGRAVQAELRRPNPRIQVVAQGVYWFSDVRVPLTWSLYGDSRMLPCFYRRYPPAISWEEVDQPDNLLPPPGKTRH